MDRPAQGRPGEGRHRGHGRQHAGSWWVLAMGPEASRQRCGHDFLGGGHRRGNRDHDLEGNHHVGPFLFFRTSPAGHCPRSQELSPSRCTLEDSTSSSQSRIVPRPSVGLMQATWGRWVDTECSSEENPGAEPLRWASHASILVRTLPLAELPAGACRGGPRATGQKQQARGCCC